MKFSLKILYVVFVKNDLLDLFFWEEEISSIKQPVCIDRLLASLNRC